MNTGRPIACNLSFVYWNPLKNSDVGVPEGTEVVVRDHNLLFEDSEIGRGTIGTDGRVRILAHTKGEDRPDVYFQVLTHGRTIDMETNRMDRPEAAADARRFLLLPEEWSSRERYATHYRPGYFPDVAGSEIGTEERPLVFRLALDCWVRFVYWNEVLQCYTGLPPGVQVELFDLNPAAHLDVPLVGPAVALVTEDTRLARGVTGPDGTAYVRAFDLHEKEPDLYFRFRIPDNLPNRVDLRTNELKGPPVDDETLRALTESVEPGDRLLGTRMPPVENGTMPLPRTWSTREAFPLEEVGRRGYWEDFRGSRVGRASNPYVFDIFQHAPPFIAGNEVRPLINGEKALARIEEAIEAAERSVHVEVMLFYDDPAGKHLTDLLIRKARQGVQVRVLFDVTTTEDTPQMVLLKSLWTEGLLELDAARRAKMLGEAKADGEGEKVRSNTSALRKALAAERNIRILDSTIPRVQLLPVHHAAIPALYEQLKGNLPNFSVARCDHRKVIVVDGKVGFTGGMNVGCEYLFRQPFDPTVEAREEANRGGAEPWMKWHDCFCEVRGPAVRELQKLFREQWVTVGGDAFDLGPRELGRGTDPAHPYFPSLEPSGNTPVKIVTTTPGARFHVHDEYLRLIDQARKEIHVENPYFSSRDFKQRLIAAARRGVRVRAVFPDDHNDSYEFLYSTRLKYEELMEAGIEVYEYQNHMTHAKVATFDDDITVIGSANFNHASMFNHFECCVVIQDGEFTRDFKREMFEHDIAHSRRITKADLPALVNLTPDARLYVQAIVNGFF